MIWAKLGFLSLLYWFNCFSLLFTEELVCPLQDLSGVSSIFQLSDMFSGLRSNKRPRY